MVTFTGTNVSDGFEGTSAADIITGLEGNDRLMGGLGGDRINGGDGNDDLSSNIAILRFLTIAPDPDTAIDRIWGGAGNDLIGGGYGDILDGSTGTDAVALDLRGAGVGLTLDFRRAIGGGRMVVGPGSITGFEGYQGIWLTAFADTVTIGDFKRSNSFGSAVYAGDGDDKLTGGRFSDMFYGDAGADFLHGGAGNDSLYGGTGNDWLVAGEGRDIVDGGDGDDILDLRGRGDRTADGGDGVDRVIFSGARSDYQVIDNGNAKYTLYYAPEGRFDLTGVEVAKFSDGYVRFDDLVPGVVVIGTDGADIIAPGMTVAGQPQVSADNDTLYGLGDDDYLDGGAGADTYYGGYGRNTFILSDPGDVAVDAHAGDTAYATLSVTNYFAGRVILAGSGNLDATGHELVGNAGNNSLTGGIWMDGGAGDDILTGSIWLDGGVGNDILNGSYWSDDVLDGGAGNDTLNGNGGLDIATYASAPSAVRVDLDHTAPQDTKGWGIDTLLNINGLIGSDFDDVLIGSVWGDDVLEGGNGNDTLSGRGGSDTASYAHAAAGVTVALISGQQNTIGAGRDTLFSMENIIGSAFDDTLTGNIHANTLDGGGGNDRLLGGSGEDRLIGGEGGDSFIFQALSPAKLWTDDWILDFSSSEGDRIDLSGIDANNLIEGDQAFSLVSVFTRQAGQLTISEFDGGPTSISGDVTGDGWGDFRIVVLGEMVATVDLLF